MFLLQSSGRQNVFLVYSSMYAEHGYITKLGISSPTEVTHFGYDTLQMPGDDACPATR